MEGRKRKASFLEEPSASKRDFQASESATPTQERRSFESDQETTPRGSPATGEHEAALNTWPGTEGDSPSRSLWPEGEALRQSSPISREESPRDQGKGKEREMSGAGNPQSEKGGMQYDEARTSSAVSGQQGQTSETSTTSATAERSKEASGQESEKKDETTGSGSGSGSRRRRQRLVSGVFVRY